MSRVAQFDTGQSIFIIGVTGFLGKLSTEKLLRSSPNIGTIHLLIRDKKGQSVEERVAALLTDSVFDVLRKEYLDFTKKIFAVTGDFTQEELGLSRADRELLVDKVSVISHLAATVRFDEKLDRAINNNVNSTKIFWFWE